MACSSAVGRISKNATTRTGEGICRQQDFPEAGTLGGCGPGGRVKIAAQADGVAHAEAMIEVSR